jgi:hypothetical protein
MLGACRFVPGLAGWTAPDWTIRAWVFAQLIVVVLWEPVLTPPGYSAVLGVESLGVVWDSRRMASSINWVRTCVGPLVALRTLRDEVLRHSEWGTLWQVAVPRSLRTLVLRHSEWETL